MLKYLDQYENEAEKKLNKNIMTKAYDAPLYEYVLDAWKSLESVSNIKIVDWQYNTKESSIDINRHIHKRKKSQKKKEKIDYKFIKDDRYGCLTLWIDIVVPEVDPKTNNVVIREKNVKKNILIPLQDERGYFHIKGKSYYLLYQLVEKSTYTSNSSITFKSLMPVVVKRKMIEKSDTEGNSYNLPVFYILLFRREVPVMLLYAAMGIKISLSSLYVGDIITFLDSMENPDYERYIYFQISSKLFVRCERSFFKKYQYVQAMIGGILEITTNRFTMDMLLDTDVWYKKLGTNGKPEKGRETLKYLQRILDNTTKKVLKMHPYHTYDAYALLRYAQMNFNELRIKDNLSLDNKRIRCNEYIASLLTKELSSKLNKVISLGNKATIEDYIDMLKISDDILLQKMHTSGILRYDDTINDMNFFSKYKWSSKGPHSLGNKNSNNIGIRYRDVHPSFIGRIDLLTCGNSDLEGSDSRVTLRYKTSLTAGTRLLCFNY